jgi:signal transduction histidine kinase
MRLRLDNLAATTGDEEAIDAVIHDLDRLDRTIDALLAFTRLDRQPTQPVAIPVGDALRDRAATWGPAAAEAGVEVVVTQGDALSTRVEFDPNHLEQILDNLIANALEAAPAGSPIELAAIWAGEHVDIHVTDHGPGLPEIDRERAFDRHWGRSPEGTGLGLAIVKRLVANNRAAVRLQETTGGGLDVVVAARRAAPLHAEAPS